MGVNANGQPLCTYHDTVCMINQDRQKEEEAERQRQADIHRCKAEADKAEADKAEADKAEANKRTTPQIR